MKNNFLFKNIQNLLSSIKNKRNSHTEALENLIEQFLYLSQIGSNDYLQKLVEISDLIQKPIEKLLNERLDTEESLKLISGEIELPFRYENGDQKRSSLAAMKSSLSYLEKTMDKRTLGILLKDAELTKGFFDNYQGKYLSSFIPFDIFNSLSKFGFSDSHFINMGEETGRTMGSDLKRQLSRCKDTREATEQLVYEIIPKGYDKLYDYKIHKASKKEVKIKIDLKKECKEVFLNNSPTGPELFYYLAGAFKGSLEQTGEEYLSPTLESFGPGKGASLKLLSKSAVQ